MLKFDTPLSDATQYATIFNADNQAIVSVQRARVYERGPQWTLYDTNGKPLGSHIWLSPRLEGKPTQIDYAKLTGWIIRRVEKAIAQGRI